MEFITKYTPRKLSTQAIDFIKFAHSNEMIKETDNLANKCAYVMKHYPKASELKKTTARNWFNDYVLINGEVFKYSQLERIETELKIHNLELNTSYPSFHITLTDEAAKREASKYVLQKPPEPEPIKPFDYRPIYSRPMMEEIDGLFNPYFLNDFFLEKLESCDDLCLSTMMFKLKLPGFNFTKEQNKALGYIDNYANDQEYWKTFANIHRKKRVELIGEDAVNEEDDERAEFLDKISDLVPNSTEYWRYIRMYEHVMYCWDYITATFN